MAKQRRVAREKILRSLVLASFVFQVYSFVTPNNYSRLVDRKFTFQTPPRRNKKCVKNLSFSSKSSDDKNISFTSNERVAGLLVSASVPLAWGTYSPVVKYLYQVEPVVPGIVFSAAYYIVASIVLNILLKTREIENSNASEGNDYFPFRGGIELGLYLFVANALQVTGLETVQADRAGFLVQLTTIIVPLLQAISNRNLQSISIRSWLACVLAFAGVLVIGMDGKDVSISGNMMEQLFTLSRGDLLVVSAAVLYSFHVVRLGRYARETTPLKLATSKANTEAALSIAVVSCLLFLGMGGAQGMEVANFFQEISTGWAEKTVTLISLAPAIGAVLWTGIVTCAYTIFAQSYGQARISPTEANLLYTIQPLFTALFGFILLGETLGPAGVVGAGLIASAVYIISGEGENTDGDDQDNENSDFTSGSARRSSEKNDSNTSSRKSRVLQIID